MSDLKACPCDVETARPRLATETPALETRGLTVTAPDGRTILRDVCLRVPAGSATGLVGPSGAGKSTLLRCLNRLIDLVPGMRVEGDVRLHGESVLSRSVDPDDLRQRVGIVLQQPVTFAGSVERNALLGARALGLVRRRREEADLLEGSLRRAALWDEVKDRLRASARSLSVGQQQRLALARSLAVGPSVLLMDEPTSALDPRSTAAVEEAILALKGEVTVVLVTHHPPQALRVCDRVACICLRDGAGELVEDGTCEIVLTSPARAETRAFLGLSAVA